MSPLVVVLAGCSADPLPSDRAGAAGAGSAVSDGGTREPPPGAPALSARGAGCAAASEAGCEAAAAPVLSPMSLSATFDRLTAAVLPSVSAGSGSAPTIGARTPTIAAAVATVTAARIVLPRLRALCSMPRNMHGHHFVVLYDTPLLSGFVDL
ncbi:hypothetical protein SCALM49S_03309 [Streptomyces californicus]